MSRFRVCIVDYKVGNLRSVENAVRRLGYDARVSDSADEVRRADALILPGVGAFGPAMQQLVASGLIGPIEAALALGRPLLGICVGMQLLATDSEENGLHAGLSWVPGHVRRLRPPEGFGVPHVGWNDVTVRQPGSPLFSRVEAGAHFYFDHTYHLECAPEHTLATAAYGVTVTAAVQRDRVMGVQFHPEKSQAAGLRLLRGFFMAAGAPGPAPC
ncbi:MAG: imidazole glycerol phosphate synthase subunit HisH [Polyangiaceae bacterium]|nr:imidazole glycerol phosphate synthase subunit HisH [Polyangiaceae bacterium]